MVRDADERKLDAMSPWKNIRLELDRTQDFPAGSVGRAFLVRLPLNDHDHVDESAFATSPQRAIIRRHWSNEPDESGVLEPSGEDWAMRCRGSANRTVKFNGTPLRLGGRVVIEDCDGEALPFRIASVR